MLRTRAIGPRRPLRARSGPSHNDARGDTHIGGGAPTDHQERNPLVPFDEVLSNWRREGGDKCIMESCYLPYAGVLDEDAQA